MTEHSPAVVTEHSNHGQNVSPTPKPPQWSRSEILSLCALILALLSFLFGPGVLKSFWQSSTGNEPVTGERAGVAHFEGVISIVNVALASTVLSYIYLRQIKFPQAKQPVSLAEKALAQFLRAWFWLWASWAVLYCWLALVWLLPLYNKHEVWPWILADFLNMLTGCVAFYLFLVLDMPSVKTTTIKPPRDETTTTDQPRDFQFRNNVKIVFSVGFLLFIIETVTIIIRNRSSLTDSPDVLLKNLVAAFTAVGMAFFIGRLDSHYLKAPRIVLAPLYLYVIIQLSWNNIASSRTSPDDPTRAIILSLACCFKFLLFWVVRSWLADGSMMRYLEDAERHYSSAS